MSQHLSRRLIMSGALSLAAVPALAATPAARRLSFSVFRNGAHIGEHQMVFAGDAGAPVVTTEVSMVVKLGPLPVYRYHHHAVERWTAGRFLSLDTATEANGKAQKVTARRSDGGLVIETLKGRVAAPANATPFTHWNLEAFGKPLFNPQEGKLLKVTAARKGAAQIKLANGKSVEAQLWVVRGETEIDDWYDAAGVWTGLKGSLKDNSVIEYRRI